MIEVIKYPSVLESSNLELRNVARDLVSGLKVYHDNVGYLVGELALSEGTSPHRNINSSPEEVDYRIFLKSALLLASQKLGSPITVTTGFPFSTFQVFKEGAYRLLENEHIIEYDTQTYGGGGRKKMAVEVDRVAIVPEVVGASMAVRQLVPDAPKNFFMISLGYGTMEAILSTEGGLVQRSSVSTFGLRYAINLITKELQKDNYLDLKTEHQIDQNFSEGTIILNRKRIDLKDLRKQVITQYYQDVISPSLRKAFTDRDFAKSQDLYLAGGGANYTDLVNMFKEEFDGFLNIHVPESPEQLASIGYCYNSLAINGGAKDKAVGLDLGNSSTIITTFKQEKEG
ncbi:ParM/StbA family protein [Lunatibacter salilacus]|uniref:ParM/StbA family protein n=1 Tax=Lunatibacter salilacus TaxID=2483804 RepID=UPI00131E0784|nr:ParM/StbA family protein [Lunatibacter salilacus]